MSFPVPEWWSRNSFAKSAAACVRSFSQINIPSSLTENATSGFVALGCAEAHAALSASMIGPSGIRVSADGVSGDCPCFAERMTAVVRSRWRARIAARIAPSFEST